MTLQVNRRQTIVIILSFTAFFFSSYVGAEARNALVIGNGGYRFDRLKNPVNDARDMASVLEKQGFDVDLLLDASQQEMENAIVKLGSRLNKGGVGLFYYAGHGVQVNGENYLIPIGTNISRESQVRFKSVHIGMVLEEMGAARNGLNIVILDACRNNPLTRSFRSSMRGLARVDGPSGTLIAYSTAPGSVAFDGKGRNGIYTKHLLKAMQIPGLSVEKVFKKVLNSVRRETREKQIPWIASSFGGDFYFKEGKQTNVRPTHPPPQPVVMLDRAYLTVNRTPSGAGVRILNIGPKYHDGIELEPGDYEIEVTAPGYQTHRGWYRVGSGNRTLDITLKENVAKTPARTGEVFRDRLRDGSPGPVMVVIPAGGFIMGSPDYEEGRDNDEGPQHRVTFSKPFAIGKYEVTFEEYDRFIKASGRVKPDDRGWGRGHRPVVQVSWEDATAYAQWLSNETGEIYRLPSEAEWEYAARAGTRTPFYFGETINTNQANYDGDFTYGNGSKGMDRGKTVEVGRFPANTWGLYDIHGNVWEWVEDCSHINYRGAPANGTAWTTGKCKFLVVRGGSWHTGPRILRSSDRSWTEPTDRLDYIGFRLARNY